jgi:hypothetical protein
MRFSSAFGLALAAGLWLASPPAPAQNNAPPIRIAGTIAKFDGQRLVVTPPAGQEVAITLPPECRVGALENRTLADIKPGDFVGSAAVMGSDGKLHAEEVHIFPEDMRGTGEGHRPWGGNESMTNATVAEVVEAPRGRMLKLRYKGGEQEIEVAPDVRVVLLVPGDRSLLKPGAAVLAFAARNTEGGLTARYVQAEKNGVKPLM